jgi:hypothetical protein
MAGLAFIPRRSLDERSWFHGLCAHLSWVVPLAVALSQRHEIRHFSDDQGLVRGLGRLPFNAEGLVSGPLQELFSWIPVAGVYERACFGSALALAAVGRLLFALTEHLCFNQPSGKKLAAALCLGASLTATLSPACQLAVGTPDGSVIGLCLGLLVLLLLCVGRPDDRRTWIVLGYVWGALLVEDRAFGVLLIAAAAPLWLRAGARACPRAAPWFFGAGALTAASFLLLMWVRGRGAPEWAEVALGSNFVGQFPRLEFDFDATALRWVRDLGPFVVVLGGLGIGALLFRPERRVAALALVCVALLDALAAQPDTALDPDPGRAIHLMGGVSLAAFSMVGVSAALAWLGRGSIPFRSPIRVLLTTVYMTMALVMHEESTRRISATEARALGTLTQEAFIALPPRALLIVESPRLARLFWANEALRAERPDVLVVPANLLQRARLTASLLASEPALAPVIRDLAIVGEPSEYSLSSLADVRPLFVELNPKWPKSLLLHLAPGYFWFRFEPHAVGYSDRRESLSRHDARVRRVLKRALGRTPHDTATLSVLQKLLRDQAAATAAVGDRERAAHLLKVLRRVDPEDPVARALQERLSERRRGPVSIAGLM